MADLNDLITHKNAWRAALAAMVEIAEKKDPTGVPDDDADLGYWRHELAVYDRTFALIGPL